MVLKRGERLPSSIRQLVDLRRGERVLAWAEATDETWLIGTRTALHLARPPEVEAIPWDEIERADWDQDDSTLIVWEVGSFGLARPVHTVTVKEPGDLLALVRERVTSTIVLQRRGTLAGGRGLNVVARRSPVDGAVRWLYEYDAGVDPEDPTVMALAEAMLQAAAEEIGAEVGRGPLDDGR